MANAAAVKKLQQLVGQIQNSDLKNDPRIQAVLAKIMEKVRGAAVAPTDDQSTYAKAKYLWDLSQGNTKAFVQYLQQVPDPQMNALIQNRAQLNSIVKKLVESNALSKTQAPGDGIPPAPLQSSNIAGFKYDKSSGALSVKFHSGAVYEYSGVPRWVYDVFSKGAVPAKTKGKNKHGSWWKGKSPSLGSSLNQMIKIAGYPYTKIA